MTLQKSLVLVIVLTLFLNVALAASGGIMGGSSFSSSDHEDKDSWSSSPYSSCNSNSDDNKVRSDGNGNGGSGLLGPILMVVMFVGSGCLIFDVFHLYRKTVLMIQVGLSATARSIQRELNEIAFTANTANEKGFHYILTETILALLRQPTHCISGYSFVEQKRNIEDLEKRFNQLSLEEREKFDTETLVNVNNIKVQRRCIPRSNKVGKDYLVVTILVAAEGTHKLPVIKDTESLKAALQYLGAIHARKIKAVHVLWTPQDENDALFKEELLENYPLLRPV